MKARRHVYMVQAQFAAKVLSGDKSTTIRANRKRMPKAGEVADLRQWSGLPYRSKQLALLIRTINSVRKFSINEQGSFYIAGGKVGKARRDEVARADGFFDADSMVRWFVETHGLPFTGFITGWNPSAEPTSASALKNHDNK